MINKANSQTIYALATPYGKSGVAIIRISGAGSLFAAEKLTKCRTFEHKQCMVTHFYNSKGDKVDYGLLLYFKTPHSFTGEDVVELHIHGSIAVIKSIIEELSTYKDFRHAEAGEFAKRAFLNNKLDLTQAEGLEDLINADTSMQLAQAIGQLDGKFHDLIWSWREQIIKIMAFVESYIDFPDEDIPKDIEEDLNLKVSNLTCMIENYMNDKKAGELIRSGIYISISGKPNVGKSSLINYFAGRDVAIVSKVAGTTRDVIETTIDIEGIPVVFADTAGIRNSTDEIERIGIDKAFKTIEKSNLKIRLFSIEDFNAEEMLNDEDTIYVVNKIDINPQQASIIAKDNKLVLISLKESKGLDFLQIRIKEHLSYLNNSSNVPFITRSRYREHLQFACDLLKDFLKNQDIVLAAEDLRLAKREIEKISGKIDVEEILDVIFSSFCIGK